MGVFEDIKDLLEKSGIDYRTVHHEPTFTSEESAHVRGEKLEVGGKAIVMKLGDDDFKLFVISAVFKTDSKKIKNLFNAKKTRFADKDELIKLTGLVPGSVPPFGRPILDLDLFIDKSITENEKIAFNAGSLTDSIIMKTSDYLRIANGEIIDIAKR